MITRIYAISFAAFLALSACHSAPGPQSAADKVDSVEAIAADLWELSKKYNPIGASYRGERQYDAKLPNISEEVRDIRRGEVEALQKRLRAIDSAQLQGQSRITAQVLADTLETRLQIEEACQNATWDVDHMGGWQANLPQLGTFQRVDSVQAAADYVTRLSGIAALLAQHQDNLRLGLAANRLAPRIAVERVIAQLGDMLQKPVDASPYLRVLDRAAGLNAAEITKLKQDITAIIEHGIRPALKGYQEFLSGEYLEKSRTAVGVSNIAGGRECYQAAIRLHTSSTKTPEEIHATGLAELERLQTAMMKIVEKAGKKSIKEYIAALDADPAQHLTKREDLVPHNKKLVEKAYAALPRAFGRLPKAPVDVWPIEGFREAQSPAAYYNPPPDDGSRPAVYYINTYKPETRPLYNMEALAYHEAVPGHHLQIAIAQELEGIPDVRRHGHVTAFVEGWGLYSEIVSEELGLYSSDATRFGMLNYQAWRACRLVVDTGMHALGWSRDKALQFMRDNLAFPDNEIANEIDRYIIWPGQALAYMLGRMEFQRFRAKAEKALGDAFDVRAFHDTVLLNGALPMPVVEQQVDAWIKAGGPAFAEN